MGISQNAVYITCFFAIKERIIHRDVTVPGGHNPEKTQADGAARISSHHRFLIS
jgi:hypothetical protein